MAVKAVLIRAAGTNCEGETAHAFRLAGAEPEIRHVREVVDSPGLLRTARIVVIPGGFSFGDDVAAGKIFAELLRRRLGPELHDHVGRGGLLLGICNGFQVLVRAGLLPGPVPLAATAASSAAGASAAGTVATSSATALAGSGDSSAGGPALDAGTTIRSTLAWNANARYTDRWVRLRADSGKCVFLTRGATLELPVAHGEGRFLTDPPGAVARLAAADMVALRYITADGKPAAGGPANPNGSTDDIAGLCDATGRVFGLMPHPERHVDPLQHPRWTRLPARCEGDGLAIFRNAVRWFG